MSGYEDYDAADAWGPDVTVNRLPNNSKGSAVVEASMFDDADRIIDAGYSYEALGRTRTVPARHTSDPDGSGLSVTYHVTDMVAALATTTGDGVAASKAFTLDPVGRLSQVTDTEHGIAVRRVRGTTTSATPKKPTTQPGSPSRVELGSPTSSRRASCTVR